MRANQLRQVVRMYTTHWVFWVAAASWLGMQLALLGWPSVPPVERLSHNMTSPLMGDLFLGIMMGAMLKLQFANPRARLLPGFAAAHLVVAGTIVASAMAIKVVLVSPLAGAGEQLALLSLAVIPIVVATWTVHLMSSAGFFLLFGLIIAKVVAGQYVAELIQLLIDRPIVPLGITCVGLAALAALDVRLWALHEEMREYPLQIPDRWNLMSRAGNRDRRRLETQVFARASFQGWLRDVEFRFVVRGGASISPWRRVMLRQLSSGFSCLSVMVAVFTMMPPLLYVQSWQRNPVDAHGVFLLSFIPLLMALSMLGGVWLQRWPHLARESLLPLGRRDFVRDVALSMACDMAAAAAAHCAMLVVGLELLWPQGPSHGLLLPWVALTVAQYVVGYCVVFWLLSFRHFWGFVLPVAVANAILASLVAAALSVKGEFWSPVNLALATLVTALAVGWLLCRLAFRRWCRIDLD
jgi:hypothetical protein